MRAVSATSARVPGALAVSRVLVRRSQSRPRTDAPDDGPPVATRVKVYSPESMRAAGAMMSRALTASQENGATVATGWRGARARRAAWTSNSREATIAATTKTPTVVRLIYGVRVTGMGCWAGIIGERR